MGRRWVILGTILLIILAFGSLVWATAAGPSMQEIPLDVVTT